MFTVALVGRPNVGKSTLYNRLTKSRHALVDDRPGVTRDYREGVAELGPIRFKVMDTAGLEEAPEDQLEARMMQQTEKAVDYADAALFLVDGREGVTPADRHFVNWLRKKDIPVVVAINKVEGDKYPSCYAEVCGFGFETPACVSAEHGDGMADLYDVLAPLESEYAEQLGDLDLELADTRKGDDKALQIAIIGRPNAGKSTLFNALLGEERVLTGPEAGITRDAIAVDYRFKGETIKLIDTAGIRRKANIKAKLEKLSLSDCFRSTRYAHVVVLLVDATQPLEKQDIAIARMMLDEGRGLIIAANKWDLVEDKLATKQLIRERVEKSLPQIKGVPVVTLSALKKKRIDEVIDASLSMYRLWNKRISTAQLNDWLRHMMDKHLPPLGSNKLRVKIKYITQGKTRPPTFMLFVNRPKDLPDSYVRYLVGGLREMFDLPGVPIRMLLRKGENPYQRSDRKGQKPDRRRRKG